MLRVHVGLSINLVKLNTCRESVQHGELDRSGHERSCDGGQSNDGTTHYDDVATLIFLVEENCKGSFG